MTLQINAVTIDCADALKVAEFWAAALDRPLDQGEPAPSPYFASIGRAEQSERPAMLFIAVPEPKSTKNRVHLDVGASADREAEVERLLALGATRLHDCDEWGMRWTTLADPEGNEFCVAVH